MNLSHFAEYPLTLARHPSETAERLMMRVIAFALFADESLRFGAGLSSADEPDLVLADLTGAIKLWIEVGLPEVRWISKALSKAEKVVVVAYGGNARRWFRSLETEFVEARRSGRLALVVVTTDDGALFQGLATRNAQLSVTIQDDQLWLTGESGTVALSVAGLKDGVQ